MANLNQSTYLYRFTYVLPGQPNGAFHGSELPFVFRPSSILKLDPVNSTVSDNMMDFWVSFAKTGNPNGERNITWPKYNAETDRYLDIGAVPVVKQGTDRLRFSINRNQAENKFPKGGSKEVFNSWEPHVYFSRIMRFSTSKQNHIIRQTVLIIICIGKGFEPQFTGMKKFANNGLIVDLM